MEPRSERSLTSRWLVQSVLGVLLVVLLGVHLTINHWTAPEGLLRYADIIRYYDVPGIAWMEIVFLMVVTVHCLMGIHAILLDLRLSPVAMRSLTWMLFTAGFVIVMFGIWLTWQVKSL